MRAGKYSLSGFSGSSFWQFQQLGSRLRKVGRLFRPTGVEAISAWT